MRHRIAFLAVSLPLFACAANPDYTPQIHVAPGVSERFAWMMRVRRSGEGNVHRGLLDGVATEEETRSRRAKSDQDKCDPDADECIVVHAADDAPEPESADAPDMP